MAKMLVSIGRLGTTPIQTRKPPIQNPRSHYKQLAVPLVNVTFPPPLQKHHLFRNHRSISVRADVRDRDLNQAEEVSEMGSEDVEGINGNYGLTFLFWLSLSAVLTALGLIRRYDYFFPALWGLYLIVVNHLRFDGNKKFKTAPTEITFNPPWAKPYKYFLIVAMMLAPVATMAVNFQNHELLVMYALPLFLLFSQLTFETLSVATKAAVMVRLLVPLGFGVVRGMATWEWCVQSVSFGTWHIVLAVLNLVLWAFNYFVILLLIGVPYYLDDRRCAT